MMLSTSTLIIMGDMVAWTALAVSKGRLHIGQKSEVDSVHADVALVWGELAVEIGGNLMG